MGGLHTVVLEQEGNSVSAVLSLDGNLVVVGDVLEDLNQGSNVDTQGEVAVASVVIESISTEEEGHQGGVVVIHSLHLHSGSCAIKVGLINQVLDGVDDLLEKTSV